MGDIIFQKHKVRTRIKSDEDNITDKIKYLPSLPNQWKDGQYENEDDRIGSFLEHLHKDADNQSQLYTDFEVYFLESKPMLSVETLKRLFHGYLKKQGLMFYL